MIYLDHNATTRLLPDALEAMTRAAGEAWANPSSLHAPGRAARAVVETAREEVAALAGAAPHEIVFTGGGTEACAFGILGVARALMLSKDRAAGGRHIVASAFEHSAVKMPVSALEAEGWEVTWVKPGPDGVVRPEDVEAALRPETALCVVMAAQNEIGTLQPVAEIGARLADRRARGLLFFCDLIQALGKVPLDLAALPVDLAPLAAHKIGGPKGVGALYLRKGVRVEPLLRGGGQERALRGGTENVPGIAGFGAAAAWWRRHGDAEGRRVAALRDALQGALGERIPEMRATAKDAPRLPNTLHATFPGARGDVMVAALDLRGIAVSAGSACASGSVKPSEALLAMGRSAEEAVSALRFSLGSGNTVDEIVPVAEAVAQAYGAARA